MKDKRGINLNISKKNNLGKKKKRKGQALLSLAS